MRHFLLISCAAVLTATFLAGCAANGGGDDANNAFSDSHIARAENQWVGTYQGIFPCQNCDGTAVMLRLNPDMTFELRSRNEGVEWIDRQSTGRFTWQENGRNINLMANNHREVYLVGRNALRLVARDGEQIPAANVNQYVLRKTN